MHGQLAGGIHRLVGRKVFLVGSGVLHGGNSVGIGQPVRLAHGGHVLVRRPRRHRLSEQHAKRTLEQHPIRHAGRIPDNAARLRIRCVFVYPSSAQRGRIHPPVVLTVVDQHDRMIGSDLVQEASR